MTALPRRNNNHKVSSRRAKRKLATKLTQNSPKETLWISAARVVRRLGDQSISLCRKVDLCIFELGQSRDR